MKVDAFIPDPSLCSPIFNNCTLLHQFLFYVSPMIHSKSSDQADNQLSLQDYQLLATEVPNYQICQGGENQQHPRGIPIS